MFGGRSPRRPRERLCRIVPLPKRQYLGQDPRIGIVVRGESLDGALRACPDGCQDDIKDLEEKISDD